MNSPTTHTSNTGARILDTAAPSGDSGRPVLCDGTDALTAGELRNRVAVMAATLQVLGCRRVALAADNGIAWLVADLACQQLDLPLLPLPTFFSPAQRRHSIADSHIDLIMVDKRLDWQPTELAATAEQWQVYPTALEGLAMYYRPPYAGDDALPAGTGKITYTSGSTGNPKGVCLGNHQLVTQAGALADVVADAVGTRSNRHLCLLPLSVLLENVAGAYTTLLRGGTVIAPPLAELGFSGSSSVDIQTMLAAIHRHRPQTLILLPQLLDGLVKACDNGWTPPPSLSFIAVGGSKVAPTLILSAREAGLPVYEGYGLSECASVVSLNRPGQDRLGSAGKPLPHLRVANEGGELIIAGNPFLGYVDDPKSWYPEHVASGDLGQLTDDGYLHLRGRMKNLLISSFGRNISPEWVEGELCDGPMLREALVLGDGRPYLVALLLPGDARTEDQHIAQWVEQVNARLPDYARIAAWLRLESPLTAIAGLTTSTGKPVRQAIAHHFETAMDQLYQEAHQA